MKIDEGHLVLHQPANNVSLCQSVNEFEALAAIALNEFEVYSVSLPFGTSENLSFPDF